MLMKMAEKRKRLIVSSLQLRSKFAYLSVKNFLWRKTQPAMGVLSDILALTGAVINQKVFIKHTIMNIKPLADRVLVLPAEAEEKVGGIIIPDTAKEKPQRGKVVAVGQGTKDEQMILKEGDVVLYGKYAGTELENEGEKYLMMRQSDVLAVVE